MQVVEPEGPVSFAAFIFFHLLTTKSQFTKIYICDIIDKYQGISQQSHWTKTPIYVATGHMKKVCSSLSFCGPPFHVIG